MSSFEKSRRFKKTTFNCLMLIILILSSSTFVSGLSQVGYSQPLSSITESNSINDTRDIMTNAGNISIQSTGESKFVEPESMGLASIPAEAEEVEEPENPIEEQAKKEIYEAKILGEPASGISSVDDVNITQFSIDQIESIDTAMVPSLNQSTLTSEQPSLNQSTFRMQEESTISSTPGFEGLSQLDSGGSFPPDATLAVGPAHVIQMVNTALKITDKQGNTLQQGTLSEFFNVNVIPARNCNPCDPIVVYDKSEDRFFASVLNVPDGTVRIAVSQINDPTEPWNTFIIRFSENGSICPDQPFISISSNKLAIGANLYRDFCAGDPRPLGTQHVIINKGDLTSQTSPSEPSFYASNISPSGFSERPVKSFATSDDIFLVGIGTGHMVSNIKLIKYSGQVPNIQQSIESVGPIRTLLYPPPASQPTSDIPLDTTGRLQSASMSPNGDYIWISSMTRCTPPGESNAIHSCIRLIQFNPNTKTIMQDFDLSIRTLDLIYPSLIVTASGDMTLAFGITSTEVFPSLVATRQPIGSIPNTLDQPILIKAGQSFTSSCDNPAIEENPTCRYGDYFGASIDADPTDIQNAWISGEYTLSPRFWGTFITELFP